MKLLASIPLVLAAGLALAALPAASQTAAEAKPPDGESRLAEPADAGEDATRRREAAEERRRMAQKEAEDRKRERERRCVIRPVMTDREIATCKEVWR